MDLEFENLILYKIFNFSHIIFHTLKNKNKINYLLPDYRYHSSSSIDQFRVDSYSYFQLIYCLLDYFHMLKHQGNWIKEDFFRDLIQSLLILANLILAFINLTISGPRELVLVLIYFLIISFFIRYLAYYLPYLYFFIWSLSIFIFF